MPQAALREFPPLAQAGVLDRAIIGALAHDLRNPLSSIKAAATSLLLEEVAWDADATRDFAQMIDDGADRLADLLADLFDLSRLEHGALRPAITVVSVEDIVRTAMAGICEGRSIAIAIPPSTPSIAVDATLLERAVANVVSNALACSPPASEVRVEADGAGDRVDLRVIDHGPGIPLEDRELVFTVFHRLRPHRTGPGLGLGLTLARAFAEVNDGTLFAEDTPSGGATFVFSLPCDTEAGSMTSLQCPY